MLDISFQVELFEKDMEHMMTELNNVSAADNSPISLYEYFHISPIKVCTEIRRLRNIKQQTSSFSWKKTSMNGIKISSQATLNGACVNKSQPRLVMFLFFQLHLSFSLSTGGEDGLKEKRDTELIPVESLNLLLKSIGATLTDVQDVVFKYEHMQMLKQATHKSAAFILVCGILMFQESLPLNRFCLLFQTGLLWVDLPVLYHSAAAVGGHQTLFQAGNTHGQWHCRSGQ